MRCLRYVCCERSGLLFGEGFREVFVSILERCLGRFFEKVLGSVFRKGF